MICDFDYCIYNENLVCTHKEIEVNSLGQCDDCIMVSIPEEKLAEYKRMQIKAIQNRHAYLDNKK